MESIRLRYYGSVFDTETIRPGQAVTDLPNLSQIMVTEIDFWGLNVLIIIFRMCAPEYSLELKNYGFQIIYVNGSYQADDRIGRMLEDLRQRDPRKIKNREFARRSFELKRSEGEAEMVREQYIDLVNELAPEIREFGLEEGRKEGEKIGERKGIWKTAVRMAENGCSAEIICASTDLSQEEVRKMIDQVRIREFKSAA